MKDQLKLLSMKDTLRSSRIALPIIALFEVLLIVRWILTKNGDIQKGSIANFTAYILLLAATLLTLLLMNIAGNNLEESCNKIYALQIFYGVFIRAWGVAFTLIGHIFFHNFDYLTYITIIMIVPIFTNLKPVLLCSLQIAGAAVLMWIASDYPRFSSFTINFTVFTIISLLGSVILINIRNSSYIRQIELEKERDLTHKYAYMDTLTELPNRRSFVEDLEKLGNNRLSPELILAMFDINGLKNINDSLGHEAGDELISGAADCLIKALGPMGTIYRVGGDEFTGILYGTEEELKQGLNFLAELTENRKGTLVNDISISCGWARIAEYEGLQPSELNVMADNAMYAAKQQYYSTLQNN